MNNNNETSYQLKEDDENLHRLTTFYLILLQQMQSSVSNSAWMHTKRLINKWSTFYFDRMTTKKKFKKAKKTRKIYQSVSFLLLFLYHQPFSFWTYNRKKERMKKRTMKIFRISCIITFILHCVRRATQEKHSPAPLKFIPYYTVCLERLSFIHYNGSKSMF